MSISIPASAAIPFGGMQINPRTVGTVQLDDGINSFMDPAGLAFPATRDIQRGRIIGRQGRASRQKEDRFPLELPVLGRWRDGGGRYMRDFRAGLENQIMVPFDLGDGSVLYAVDVVNFSPVRIAGIGGSPTPDELWAWAFTAVSYEPFSREKTPVMQTPIATPAVGASGAFNTGNGSITSNFSLSYKGTASGEPSFLFTLVVPAGVTVTSVRLQNTTTNESCTIPGLTLGTGTWYLIMDASGGYAVGGPNTPGNSGYNVFPLTSVGWGCTLQQSGGTIFDADFTGVPPTLKPTTTPFAYPLMQTNNFVATVTANGALTSARLDVMAPARFIR